MKKILLALLLLAQLPVFAGIGNPHLGGRSAALGHASVTLRDVWSLHNNQAGLAFLKQKLAVGAYYENRFNLSEMALRGAVLAVPTKGGTFGVSVQQFGFSAYNESKYALGYARKFGDNFAVGVQLNYMTVRFQRSEYGSRELISAEIGIQANITDKLKVGAQVFNPTTTELDDYDNERLPTIMRAGLQYDFSEKVLAFAEIEKDVDQPAHVKLAVEYQVIELIHLRAGLSTNPFRNSFGFGLNLKGLSIDIATTYHEVLGYTPQVGLSYKF